jgi:hypothetical protein
VAQALVQRAFVAQHQSRLIFALDATASREDTWNAAQELTAAMFDVTTGIGTLEMQLVYYRGDECRASRWVKDAASLKKLMSGISCVGGLTQINRILQHTLRENDKQKIAALVLVGDCCEEEMRDLIEASSALGHRNVPAFMFQELEPAAAETNAAIQTFKTIAQLTGGVWAPFNNSSAGELKRLLRAAARYAAAPNKAEALENMKKSVAGLLTAP